MVGYSCSSTGIVANGIMNSGTGGIANTNYSTSSLPTMQYLYGSTSKISDNDGSTPASIEQDKQVIEAKSTH